ncbi:hypothetical protein [Pararhizobium sp. DWP1-1-3]|uniref:phage scaffolding protein n=1 Tax=Pararhizobium sp. DWP1-1-3 TaxID=2804652 RepID=UPI003CF48A5B
MKITNTQKGPRGINTVSGPVLIDPKQTVEAKVFSREKDHVEASGWFEIDGDYETDPETSTAPAQVTVTSSEGKDGVYIPASEFNAMRESFETLTKQLAERDDEIAKLKADKGPSERDELKKQADELQLEYPGNISNAKLKELIDAKLAS